MRGSCKPGCASRCTSPHSSVIVDDTTCAFPFSFSLPGRSPKGLFERAREAPRRIPEPNALERVLDEDRTETLAPGRPDRRSVPLLPGEPQLIVAHPFPLYVDSPGRIAKRTIFDRVGRKLMQRQADVQ